MLKCVFNLKKKKLKGKMCFKYVTKLVVTIFSLASLTCIAAVLSIPNSVLLENKFQHLSCSLSLFLQTFNYGLTPVHQLLWVFVNTAILL